MVWAHCQSQEVLDDSRCPTCGMSKAEWTVHVDATRVFKVSTGKKRAAPEAWLEVAVLDRDGRPVGSGTFDVDLPNGRRVRHQLQEGLCRLEKLAPGACRVTFDGLRPRGVADGEPTPPGPVRMVEDPTTRIGEGGVSCATGTRLTVQLCHHLEVQLTDHEGVSVADEPFFVEFADGTPRIDGRLDARGQARILGLLRGGPCTVVFPKRRHDDVEHTRTL